MDTKSLIPARKHTLLHYLAELVELRFPLVVGFENQIKRVEEGSKGKLSNLNF